jgi:hypothetical protein
MTAAMQKANNDPKSRRTIDPIEFASARAMGVSGRSGGGQTPRKARHAYE